MKTRSIQKILPSRTSKEDRKIGYSVLIVGMIALVEAWLNIIAGKGNYTELFFLAIGLMATLWGVALILQLPKRRSD